MKHHHLLSHAIALCLLNVSATATTAFEPVLGELAWLSGCWSANGSESGSGEQWTPLAGASLLGVSRTVRQGKKVAYEFMRIAPGLDGKLAFFAQPSGKPATSFPLRSMSGTDVIFENLEHDFPQRVIYRLESPAQMRASIEGLRNGSLRNI